MELAAETPFRIVLAVVLVVTPIVTVSHRRRAAKLGTAVSRAEEGLATALALRLAGLGLWLATLAYLLAPQTTWWAAFPCPAWLRWCGGAGAALGIGLIHWTLAALGSNLTDTVAVRANAQLVTDGPYRWVRHPYYTSAAVLMASVTLLTANGLIGALSLVVLILLALRTPREEAQLVERFGPQYRRYVSLTPRFWPRRRQ